MQIGCRIGWNMHCRNSSLESGILCISVRLMGGCLGMKAQRGIEGQCGLIRTDNSLQVDVVTDAESNLTIVERSVSGMTITYTMIHHARPYSEKVHTWVVQISDTQFKRTMSRQFFVFHTRELTESAPKSWRRSSHSRCPSPRLLLPANRLVPKPRSLQ